VWRRDVGFVDVIKSCSSNLPQGSNLSGIFGWMLWCICTCVTIPESLLPCCKLLLRDTIASTKPTSRLYTKDRPSHRRRFYIQNLNGTDLQALQNLPKISIYFIPYNSFYFSLLLVIFNLNTCCIFESHIT
jgi:hypothetical protein